MIGINDIMLISVPEIPGLYLIPDVFDQEQEDKIICSLEEIKGHDCKQIHDATEFGWKFIPPEVKTFDDKLDDFPEHISEIWTQIPAMFPKNINYEPDHVLLNKYVVGDGCNKHVDDVKFWQQYIVGVSFGSGCTMTFDQISDSTVSYDVYLPSRSAYVLSSDARYHWQHSIPFQTSDNFYGKEIDRKVRYSLTYRAISKMYLPSSNNEKK